MLTRDSQGAHVVQRLLTATVCAFLLLGAATVAASPDPPAKTTEGKAPLAGLVILQRANGLPGTRAGELVPQRLLVGAGSIRIDDQRAGGRFLIVRLNEGVIHELDPTLHLVKDTRFRDLKAKREKAEREREAFRLSALKRHKDGRLTGDQLDRVLRKRGLRRDGRTHLTTRVAPDRVGRWKVQRYTIALNEKVYIQVFATKDLHGYTRPPELFRFYDQAGLFPRQVMEALKGIEGFPVRVVAHLDYFSAGAEIVSDVEDVMAWDPVDPKLFEIPAGYRTVEEFPKPVVARNACPVCGRPNARLRVPGSRVRVDSQACMRKYMQNPGKYKGSGTER